MVRVSDPPPAASGSGRPAPDPRAAAHSAPATDRSIRRPRAARSAGSRAAARSQSHPRSADSSRPPDPAADGPNAAGTGCRRNGRPASPKDRRRHRRPAAARTSRRSRASGNSAPLPPADRNPSSNSGWDARSQPPAIPPGAARGQARRLDHRHTPGLQNSLTPSSRSRLRTPAETADCTTCSRSEARVKLPSYATATNVASCPCRHGRAERKPRSPGWPPSVRRRA